MAVVMLAYSAPRNYHLLRTGGVLNKDPLATLAHGECVGIVIEHKVQDFPLAGTIEVTGTA